MFLGGTEVPPFLFMDGGDDDFRVVVCLLFCALEK